MKETILQWQDIDEFKGIGISSKATDTFRQHIEARGHEVSTAYWDGMERHLLNVSARRGAVLLDASKVTEHLFFVCHGVAASIQTSPGGDEQIARFFEYGHLCSNLTSAWHHVIGDDQLIAMSDFLGVRIPFSMFRDEFFSEGPLSLYWREMAFETLLFDKDLICAKTIRNVETRYRFLAERYENVVSSVPDKYIARFLGITPQALSRFLKNHRKT